MSRLLERAPERSTRRLTAVSTLTLGALVAACADAPSTAPHVAARARSVDVGAAVSQVTVSATSCATIQGVSPAWRELKVPPESGTYADGNVTVTITKSGRYFSWSMVSARTVGIDAVLGRAAPSASLYRYDPPAEATHDEGLSGPINKTHPSSPPAQLRSVIFCYDLEPATGA